MTGGQWRAGNDRRTVEGKLCQGCSGGQALTGVQWRADSDSGTVESRLYQGGSGG